MFTLFAMMGCFENERRSIELLCLEIQNLEAEVLKPKIFPSHRNEMSCSEISSGIAFVDGYLQAIDRSWSNAIYETGDTKKNRLPTLAEPIVGSWVWFYPQCEKEKEKAMTQLQEGMSKVLERIESHTLACQKQP